MTQALPPAIQSCVESELLSRNAEVVARAINRRKLLCPKCHYPENATLYNMLVDQHRKEIIQQWQNYRAWKTALIVRYEEKFGRIDQYDTHFDDWLIGQAASTRWHLSFKAAVVDPREYKLASVSAQLREITPCEDCIKKYNPRRKKGLPSRAQSSLLEEVRQFL